MSNFGFAKLLKVLMLETVFPVFSLCLILDIVYNFVRGIYIKYTEITTGRSHFMLVDWYYVRREVCTNLIQRKDQMIGSAAEPIQMDKGRSLTKRIYINGRLLQRNGGP